MTENCAPLDALPKRSFTNGAICFCRRREQPAGMRAALADEMPLLARLPTFNVLIFSTRIAYTFCHYCSPRLRDECCFIVLDGNNLNYLLHG